MPQRFLKPGLTSSVKWNACSWQAQSYYIRLLTLVDDFGRCEGMAQLLRSLAFPLNEDIRTPQVQKLCLELQANQLAVFYKVDGKEYVQLTNWTERARAPKSRYPGPDGKLGQWQANAAERSGTQPPSPSSSPSPPSSSPPPPSPTPTSSPARLSFEKSEALKLSLAANGSTANGHWKGQLRRILEGDSDYAEPNNRVAWESFFELETEDFAKVLVKKFESSKTTIERIGAYLSRVAIERGRWPAHKKVSK